MNKLEVDIFAIMLWALVTFSVMIVITLTYNIARRMIAISPSQNITPPTTTEYSVSINTELALTLYNEAKNRFDNMEYNVTVTYCHNAIREVFSKVLQYLQIPFSQDLNIVDMSMLMVSKGVKISFVQPSQYINSIKLKSILNHPISHGEASWVLSACKTIMESCKDLPLIFHP